MNKNFNDDFANRLLLSLKNIGYRVNNISGLTVEINKLFSEKSISPHAVRKWLTGKAIPIHSRLLRLSEWLGVSSSWLRFGEGEMYLNHISDAKDFDLFKKRNYLILFSKINSLSEEELQLVINQIDLFIKIKKL